MNPAVREIQEMANEALCRSRESGLQERWGVLDRNQRLISLMERLGVNFKARFKTGGTVIDAEDASGPLDPLRTRLYVRLDMGPLVVCWVTEKGVGVGVGRRVLVSMRAKKSYKFMVLPTRDVVLDRTKISVRYLTSGK